MIVLVIDGYYLTVCTYLQSQLLEFGGMVVDGSDTFDEEPPARGSSPSC